MSVLQYVSVFSNKTPEVVLKSLFAKYDLDGNGCLDKEEIYKLLEDDLGMTEEQADTYRHLLDRDGDSNISYEEFKKWLISGESFRSINDQWRYYLLQHAVEMFKQYDIDDNLAIDAKEFHKLYNDYGGQGTEGDALKEIDLDHNGRVSFQEFLKWLNWIPMDEQQKIME